MLHSKSSSSQDKGVQILIVTRKTDASGRPQPDGYPFPRRCG